VLGRVLRPNAPSQDIETCSKEQRRGRGLLLEPCDDALQAVPGDGSLFGLHTEEVEGGDRTGTIAGTTHDRYRGCTHSIKRTEAYRLTEGREPVDGVDVDKAGDGRGSRHEA
jgi:hypothetical protein